MNQSEYFETLKASIKSKIEKAEFDDSVRGKMKEIGIPYDEIADAQFDGVDGEQKEALQKYNELMSAARSYAIEKLCGCTTIEQVKAFGFYTAIAEGLK